MLDRRTILTSVGSIGLASTVATIGRRARAETYPSRPITIVVPFTPGGNSDVAARIVGAKLQEIVGRTVIVVNRAGAGGIIGGDYVNRSTPDGYTLLAASNGPLSLGPVFRKPPYDAQKDFAPIGLISWTPEAIVAGAQFGPKTIAELIEYAKTKTVRAGTGGIETAPGIALELFRLRTGIKVTEVVYAGASLQYPPLMGGEIDIAVDQISAAAPMSKGNAVRILAIADKTRSAMAPDVPTLKEAGVAEIVAGAYICLVAPAKAPPEIIAFLQTAFAKVMASSDVRNHLIQIGSVVPDDVSPAALLQTIALDTDRAKAVAAELKAKNG